MRSPLNWTHCKLVNTATNFARISNELCLLSHISWNYHAHALHTGYAISVWLLKYYNLVKVTACSTMRVNSKCSPNWPQYRITSNSWQYIVQTSLEIWNWNLLPKFLTNTRWFRFQFQWLINRSRHILSWWQNRFYLRGVMTLVFIDIFITKSELYYSAEYLVTEPG